MILSGRDFSQTDRGCERLGLKILSDLWGVAQGYERY